MINKIGHDKDGYFCKECNHSFPDTVYGEMDLRRHIEHRHTPRSEVKN